LEGVVGVHNTDEATHGELFDTKVDKIEDKGLSTNDYDNI
jgi:hypothetical protein